jgi:hypothetical protein
MIRSPAKNSSLSNAVYAVWISFAIDDVGMSNVVDAEGVLLGVDAF